MVHTYRKQTIFLFVSIIFISGGRRKSSMGIIFDRPCLSRSSFVHIQYNTMRKLPPPPSELAGIATRNPLNAIPAPTSLLGRAYANAERSRLVQAQIDRSVVGNAASEAEVRSGESRSGLSAGRGIGRRWRRTNDPSQPPFLAPPAAFSLSLSFLRSPSSTFLTWFNTCTFCAEPLQSSGL